MLALWSDSYNPETLAEFNGDREAYIKSLTPEGRAVLSRVESFLSLSGGATQSGAILNTESVDSLTKSFESGELTAEDFSSEIGHLTTAQQARFLQRFVQRLNLIDQGKELLMNSADAKAVALSIHKTLANYATVEYFFKLAAALHFEKTRRMSWDDATRMGARPTADYAGGSAVIQKWTTNWDQILPGTESAARKAMREQRDLGVLDLGNRALNGFGRLMFSNIFLMFQATAIPTHMYAAIRHPLRASASIAMLSSAAYYITQALAGEDEEERVLEATREMAGMDSWALLSKDQVDDIVNAFKGLVGDSTMSNGTFFNNDLPGVVRKLISTKPFQAVGAPERGRSTVIDLSDFSSPAMSFAMQMYEKGLHLRKGEGLRSLDRGAFFAGFLPEALVGTAHWARNFIMDRERTLYQKSFKAAKGLASQFAAGLHPMTRFASPDAKMVMETFTGRSIYEMSEGLPAMPYEQPTLGATTANFVMGMAARKGQVYSIKGSLAKFPEDKPTRLQRLVENVFGPVFTKKLSKDTVLEAKVKRATSASRANLERSFRAAYREHYYLEQAGIPQTFDNVLRRYFLFNRDVTEVGTYRDPGIRKDAVTPMGVFIRNAYEEDPEYGKYVQTATTRMVRDYIFKDKRYHALMEMSRRRLVDPSIAERMFSGLIDSSNYEIASLAREILVKRGDLKDLRTWYSVISRIPVDDMTGILGKEAARDLYRLFANHNMFDDVHAPDLEDLNKLFGASMYDALPTQVILNLERR
jgi:hypothetical protein